MAEAEDKGFVFKDRRKLSQEDEEPVKEAKPREEPAQTQEKKTDDRAYPPLPEVNFSTFIVSLSTEILFHLGEIAHPGTGERRKDLVLAKHAIDTLAMMQEKTKGNLIEEEQKLLESMLYDLRMCFIRAS
jgi:hypothetical protein